MAIYYVNGQVASSGDGTTFATAKKTITEGIALATSPGDEVHILQGTYGSQAITPAASGTESDPIIIKSIDGPVILDGEGSAAAGLNNSGGEYDYWRIEGPFEFTDWGWQTILGQQNSGSSRTVLGWYLNDVHCYDNSDITSDNANYHFQFQRCSGLTLKNCKSTRCPATSIAIGAVDKDDATNILIEDFTDTQSITDIVKLDSVDGLTIRNLNSTLGLYYDDYGTLSWSSPPHPDGIDAANNDATPAYYNIVIEGCTIEDKKQLIYFWASANGSTFHNIAIRNNLLSIYRYRTAYDSTAPGVFFDMGQANATVSGYLEIYRNQFNQLDQAAILLTKHASATWSADTRIIENVFNRSYLDNNPISVDGTITYTCKRNVYKGCTADSNDSDPVTVTGTIREDGVLERGSQLQRAGLDNIFSELDSAPGERSWTDRNGTILTGHNGDISPIGILDPGFTHTKWHKRPRGLRGGELGDDYKIAIIGDTQAIVNAATGGGDPLSAIQSQVSWINSNCALALHVGDLVGPNTTGTVTANFELWRDEYLHKVTIPFFWCPGNWDIGTTTALQWANNRVYDNYNTYTDITKGASGSLKALKDRDYYVGSMDGFSTINWYGTVTLGTTDYIIVCGNFGPHPHEIEWGKSIFAQYPNHKGIYLIHSYIGDYDASEGGYFGNRLVQRKSDHGPHISNYWGLETQPAVERTRLRVGQEIWDEYLRYIPNLRYVFSGHEHRVAGLAGYRLQYGNAGNRVHSFLVNYQSTSGATTNSDHIRILTCRQRVNKVEVTTYSPFDDANRTGAEEEFTIDGY